MGFAKRIVSNGVAGVVQKIVRILDQLFLVPFFLIQWGAEYYGEWLTLTIIPSVLAFADLGFGSAVSNSFVLSYAAEDKQKAADIAKNGFYIILLSVCLGVLLTIGILCVGDYMGLFAKSLIDAHDAMLAVTFMMAAKLIGFFSHMIEGFFRAIRRAHVFLFLGSGHNILNIIVGLIVLYSGYGVVGFALSQLIISVLYNPMCAAIGWCSLDFDGRRGALDKSLMKQTAVTGLGFMMSPIWQSIYFQGGTFVVRVVLGAEAVAVYNTVRTVCRSISHFYSITYTSILPDMQYEYGRGNMSVVRKLFRISMLLSMIIGLLGTIGLMLFGLDLYEIWTRSVLAVPQSVWYTFMVGILLNAVWWTSTVVYPMTNKPYFYAVVSIIIAVVSVGLSYILSNYLGLLGAAIGAIAFDAIMACIILPDTCKLVGMRVTDIFCHISEDISLMKRKLLRKNGKV